MEIAEALEAVTVPSVEIEEASEAVTVPSVEIEEASEEVIVASVEIEEASEEDVEALEVVKMIVQDSLKKEVSKDLNIKDQTEMIMNMALNN